MSCKDSEQERPYNSMGDLTHIPSPGPWISGEAIIGELKDGQEIVKLENEWLFAIKKETVLDWDGEN